MAEAVLSQTQIEEIIFIPCGNPPHKSGKSVWDAEHRLEMIKLLTENKENMFVSDIEINCKAKSYTANTLVKMKKDNPDIKLFFIVGADSLCYMDKWMMPEIIFQNAEIICIDRMGYTSSEVTDCIVFLEEKYEAVINKVYMERVDISSSFLRSEIEKGNDVSQYTGQAVYQYILENINEV